MDNRTRLPQAIEELQTLTRLDEFPAALRTLTTSYGVSHMTFLVVRTAAGLPAVPCFCTTYSQEWIAAYFDNDYLTIDPVVGIARWGFFPVDWSTLGRRSSRVKRLFDDARAHGVGLNGLTVPVRGVECSPFHRTGRLD